MYPSATAPSFKRLRSLGLRMPARSQPFGRAKRKCHTSAEIRQEEGQIPHWRRGLP